MQVAFVSRAKRLTTVVGEGKRIITERQYNKNIMDTLIYSIPFVIPMWK